MDGAHVRRHRGGPDGLAGARPRVDEVTAVTHCGTHVDAPWHYGPTSGGAPATRIDECPLESFFGDGVVRDLRHKQPGERISVDDLERALAAIRHRLAPLQIVMLMTGRDALGTKEYFEQPGMTRDSTLSLTRSGIRVIGIDAYRFDQRFEDMRDEYQQRRRRDPLGGPLRRHRARVLPDREAREPRPDPAADRLQGRLLPDQGRGRKRRMVPGGRVRLTSADGASTPQPGGRR
jgi:hypothetical protein